jgi:pimeloyl-ACP methyl ester carboxylesterase
MRSEKAFFEGNSITFYQRGGSKPTVLFLHGNSFSGRAFERQFSADLGKNMRLIAIDLPGHGNSPPPSDPEKTYCFPGYAEILHKLIAQLDLQEVILVGWSLGGHIALEAALNNPDVAGYFIFGAPPLGKPLSLDKAIIPHPALKLLFDPNPSEDDAVEFVKANFHNKGTPPGVFLEDVLRADGSARSFLGQSLAAGSYADEVRIVADLAVPLGIVHGEHDPFINAGYFDDLNMPTLWRQEVQIIPDAGHAPFYEQPAIFNSLLKEFVRHSLG